MVSTGPDRDHTILLRHPYCPTRSRARPTPAGPFVLNRRERRCSPTTANTSTSPGTSTTADRTPGDEGARLGLGVRPDPLPGARRHAARRRALAHLRQAARDHGDEFVSRRGRHDPGPARPGQVHHACRAASSPAACCWSTTWPTRASRWRRGRAPARHAGDQRAASAVLWTKGVSSYKPDYYVEMLPTSPWIHQPFEEYDDFASGRSGEEVPDLMPVIDARRAPARKSPPKRAFFHIHFGAQEGTRTPTALTAST